MVFYLPWISFADAGIRIILGRFVRVFTGFIRVITQRFVSPSIPSKPRFHSLINFGRNLNFLIVVLFFNQSYFFRGGLMSESFSIWFQSTKKSAKSSYLELYSLMVVLVVEFPREGYKTSQNQHSPRKR